MMSQISEHSVETQDDWSFSSKSGTERKESSCLYFLNMINVVSREDIDTFSD
jgi:hypothetical protein